jgi:uncharacterized membrane protein
MSTDKPATGSRLTDVTLVLGLVILADIALLVPGVPAPVEWAIGVPFLLALPGYALVSALMPEAPQATGQHGSAGPGWPVRIGLSLVASILVVTVVGLVANATVGIELLPTVVGISLVTAALALVAIRRRHSLAADRRANLLASGVGPSVGTVLGSTLQTAVFGVALLALVSAIAFAGMAQPGGQSDYTEFYVLEETDNGTLVANEYPTELTAGEETQLHIGVKNVEHRSMSYEVLVRARNGTGTGSGAAVEQLDRFEVQLEHGDRAVINRTVAPETIGDSRQVELLLYKGSAPADPGTESADLALRMWVDVEDPLA